MTNIMYEAHAYTDVELYIILYWQEGMAGWANIPDSLIIPNKETYFAVGWISKTNNYICCETILKVNDVIIAPTSESNKCVSNVNEGRTITFSKLNVANKYDLEIIFNCPTPSCNINLI